MGNIHIYTNAFDDNRRLIQEDKVNQDSSSAEQSALSGKLNDNKQHKEMVQISS